MNFSQKPQVNKNITKNKKIQQQNINISKYKTVLCKHFNSQKGCILGLKCQFAHGIIELRQPNRINENDGKKKGPILENYKIVKCKFWEKDHTCKYGSLCTFAHGNEELRTKSDNILQARVQGFLPLNNINNNFNYVNNFMNPLFFGMNNNNHQIYNSSIQNLNNGVSNNNIDNVNNSNGGNNISNNSNNEQIDLNFFNLKGIFNSP